MAKTKNTDMPFAVFSHEADIDYLLARFVNFLGAGFHSRAGYSGHQACEKYMKALTVQHDGTYLQTHKLLDLASKCAKINNYFDEDDTKKILTTFDAFEQVGRYGGAANFDPLAEQATTVNVKVVGVMFWSESYLFNLDAFVYKTRSLLDFSTISFVDSFKMILARQRGNLLGQEWKGRPPLRVVLTRKNKYFK